MVIATPPGVIPGRPTLYKGIRMRSRLEADYAAELDRLGGRWEYEPECFAGQDGQWLPDFGSTYSADGPMAMFTEVKPSGPLRKLRAGSTEFEAHVDAVLSRIEVAWDSRPDAFLSLVFWDYGGPWYLHLFSRRRGDVWFVERATDGLALPWIGMGQFEYVRDGRMGRFDQPGTEGR